MLANSSSQCKTNFLECHNIGTKVAQFNQQAVKSTQMNLSTNNSLLVYIYIYIYIYILLVFFCTLYQEK
jgi:hypothetical protein